MFTLNIINTYNRMIPSLLKGPKSATKYIAHSIIGNE